MSLESCSASDSDSNITPMSKRAARPSIGITDEDEANMERLMEAIPVLRSFKRASLLLYLVRIGMDSLAENPLRALEAEPTAEAIQASIETVKARIRAERERGRGPTAGIPTPQDLRDTPTTDVDHSKQTLERARPKARGKDLTREASDAELQRGRRASGRDERPR